VASCGVGPAADEAVIPNNTTAETTNNGFNMMPPQLQKPARGILQPNNYLARIICQLGGDKFNG
jgi:hypothetical protein